MSQPEEKLTTPVSLTVDALLCLGFFGYMFTVTRVHVPSRDPHMVALFGAAGAACLTGVFWLALQMFRAVLRAQRAAGRKS